MDNKKTILKLTVTNECSEAEHFIEGSIELAKVLSALNSEIRKLNNTNPQVGKAVLSGLISDCGITIDDFKSIEKINAVAATIPDELKKAFIKTMENVEKQMGDNNA